MVVDEAKSEIIIELNHCKSHLFVDTLYLPNLLSLNI